MFTDTQTDYFCFTEQTKFFHSTHTSSVKYITEYLVALQPLHSIYSLFLPDLTKINFLNIQMHKHNSYTSYSHNTPRKLSFKRRFLKSHFFKNVIKKNN